MTDRPTIQQNDFLTNPGTDWIATDARGRVLSRAGDEAAVRRAAPDAAWYGRIVEDYPVPLGLDTLLNTPVGAVNEALKVLRELGTASTADPVGFAPEALDADLPSADAPIEVTAPPDETTENEPPAEEEPAPQPTSRKRRATPAA